jgi:hypothetical protein
MNKPAILALIALAALVTACPRNQYVVELTPQAEGVERQLTFYREDGTDTNGAPNYQAFPDDQLLAIKALYPPDAVKADGKRFVARAVFSGAMPGDIGGAGNWISLKTSLGQAVFYAERFRGDDDLATTSAKRLLAADQLTDLLIGWSRQELGAEPRYENLRKFLDADLRRDLKNLGVYQWVGGMAEAFRAKASEEFVVRYGQYLLEHGYFKPHQLPEWFATLAQADSQRTWMLIQRLVADKLCLATNAPFPPSFAFLADEKTAQASFEKYLATTELFRVRLRQWEAERVEHPDAKEPKPGDLETELITVLLGWDLGGSEDHLTVKLALPSEPLHTNGKWDTAQQRVLWEADLGDKPERPQLPAFCYASWSEPNRSFQEAHFGRVLLAGEDLLQYCLWHASLSAPHAGEWDALLGGAKPDSVLTNLFDAFRFSDETSPTNSAAELPRSLLRAALTNAPSPAPVP